MHTESRSRETAKFELKIKKNHKSKKSSKSQEKQVNRNPQPNEPLPPFFVQEFKT